LTSPAGRPYVATEDPQGRVVRLEMDGIDPVSFNYDPKGQLNSIVHGTGPESRETLLSYLEGGAHLATITDPEQRVLRYSDYDGAGRAHTITLPNGETITLAYDARGRIISLAPPGSSDHGFAYTPFGAMTRYDPPALPDTSAPLSLSYDKDRFLTRASYPDGSTIDPVYAPVEGQLTQVRAPDADLSLSWYPTPHPSQGAVETIDYANETRLTFSYDGSLLLSTVWSGAVSGLYEQSFDNNLRVQQDSVNSAHPISYGYDSDGFLIQAGALELRRDELPGAPRNGGLTGTALGFVVTEQSYNAFGELETFAARFDDGVLNESLYSFTLERDKRGRITRQTEVMPSGTTVIRYEYDLAGQLERVFADDIPLRSYQYDSNGNRLIRASDQETDAEYDAQDRLLRAGQRHYQYDANGTLATASQGADTTSYTHDIHGNLKAVLLPDGSSIDYAIDGLNRRVGKAMNGATVRQWLYRDNIRLAAGLDAAGQVDTRFVYATRPNVPDYLERGGQKYRILTDHLGSPRLVVNAVTGEIVQQMAFDEFGQLLLDSNPGFQPFGFAGGQHDPDTGLIRFGARDYDPEVGRFVSKDRALFGGGSTNLYRYANNDPVNYVDISGFKPGLMSRIDNALAWQWIEDELGLDEVTSLGEIANRFSGELEKLGSQSAACRLLVEPIKDVLGVDSIETWESIVDQLKKEDMIGIFDKNGCPVKDGDARVQKRQQEWAERERACKESLGI
jgi:RHS repeat-associated protein